MDRSLLSGRSQQRLIELHRFANTAIQELNQHHSLLIGALRGCDSATQKSMLEAHRTRAANAVQSLVRLGTFLEHCRIASETTVVTSTLTAGTELAAGTSSPGRRGRSEDGAS